VTNLNLDVFVADLERLRSEAETALANAADTEALEAARVVFLGAKNGQLKALQKGLGKLGGEDKPAGGQQFNAVKKSVEELFLQASQRVEAPSKNTKGVEQADVTLPGNPVRFGCVHPITQTIRRVSSIMANLGFEAVDGPEVEDQWHNFEALAIPNEHPARDPLDNFYIAVANTDRPLLLRSQTSTVQIRVMEQRKPPLRIVSLGRVYRPDTADATHYPMFHQVEGLLIEPGATMAHLKSVLRSFASSFLW